MGNCCIRGSSSMVWGGEDWGSMGRVGPDPDEEKHGLLGGSGSVAGAEMKIKISKKQLEVLLRKNKAVTVEKVLERLIEKSVGVQVRRRSWRPKLQSIPELD